jgi:8-oxo-dGTP pyrophosphatase MutT (NUDIX family)
MTPDANGRFLVVVAFVIERDNHVLLLRRSLSKDHAAGEWEPGSGRVRQGEAALAAVLREAKEETGLDVTVLGLLDTFHCRATGKDVTLSPEHVEAKCACSEWIRRSFAALLARRYSEPLYVGRQPPRPRRSKQIYTVVPSARNSIPDEKRENFG